MLTKRDAYPYNDWTAEYVLGCRVMENFTLPQNIKYKLWPTAPEGTRTVNKTSETDW